MIVVFDWDGTLCDSVEGIVSAMQAAAGELAVEVPSTAAVRDIIGLGLPQAVATLFPGLDEQQRESLAATYSRHYVNGDRQPKLFDGALETLDGLRDRGLELAVATGKSRRGLDRVLAELGLADFFDATRCADETRSKPDPLMLTQIMAERDKAPSQMMMVGDTEYDLDMAAQAGVVSVGVSFGVHSRERLARHAPLQILDELPELLGLGALAAS